MSSSSSTLTLPPQGFQDTLPDECAFSQRLRDKLRSLFEGWGYLAIETPILETYDLFNVGPGALPQQRMWKTTAPDGRILVIRPDLTTPAVRLACARLSDAPLPLRLFYQQSVLKFPGVERSAREGVESRQTGVELLGETAPEADAEAVGLAIRALKEMGLINFRIDIGHVGFFKGLMDEAGLSPEQTEQLRALVEEKNQLAIALMLRDASGMETAAQRIMGLPMLFGGLEVIEQARRMSSHPLCRSSLDNLAALFGLLHEDGLDKYCSIDLGMVHAIHYYTGTVFRGITGAVGQPLLSGGRYDALPESMGRAIGAVGFGLTLEPLMSALTRQGNGAELPRPGALIGYAPGCRAAAFAEAERLRALGTPVAMVYTGDMPAMIERARVEGIASVVFAETDGIINWSADAAGESK
ncbi:MAG: ATP phosphoribosyltransferase regulatory subunit [Oscillospiraceae bacterium]|nr:ATP phosphoribosyltransferase regulatory subunit [Oscillospiraceae bacterium]